MSVGREVFGVAEPLESADPQLLEWHETALKALEENFELLEGSEWKSKSGWKVESSSASGDICYSRTLHDNKAYMLVAELPMSAEKVFHESWFNIEKTPEWNPNTKEFRSIFKIGSQSDINYNCSNDFLIIKARDVVGARCWRKIGDGYAIAGHGVKNFKDMPPQKGRVRAWGYPGIYWVKPIENKPDHCNLEFLMNLDIKGMIPKTIVNQFMYKQLMDYVENFRAYIARDLS